MRILLKIVVLWDGLHSKALESRTCSGCSHCGVNLQAPPPNKLGTPTGEAFFNGILLTEVGGRLGEAPRVTGDVHAALVEIGRLASPFYKWCL